MYMSIITQINDLQMNRHEFLQVLLHMTMFLALSFSWFVLQCDPSWGFYFACYITHNDVLYNFISPFNLFPTQSFLFLFFLL